MATGTPIKIVSPFNGSVIYKENTLTKSELKDVLAKISKARQEWNANDANKRRAILTKFVELLKHQRTKIAEDITRQTGKTITNSTSQVEDAFAVMDRQLTYKHRDNRDQLKEGYTLEPFGNVVIASPYTTPFFTPSKYMIIGLLVGNGVLIKSSDQCLLTTNTIAAAFKQASGLETVVPLHANLEVLQLLLEDKDTGFINFTGLTKSGHQLYKQIATKSQCFAESVFHISASDAAYVRADANLVKAVPMLAKGALVNSGQSRNAIKRIYVATTRMEEFCRMFVEQVSKFRIGDPMDPVTNLSPIVSTTNYKELLQLKATLQAEKMTLLYEGSSDKAYEGSRFIMPMVYLANEECTYRFENEQIYGPFVFLKAVEGDEQAIEQLNQTVFGKRCVVVTGKWEEGIEIGKRLEVGSFSVNSIAVHHPDLPQSGRKRSGKGFSLSQDSIRNIGKTLSIIM